MRRRDATDDHSLDNRRRGRRRIAASATLSLALHVVLVAIATLIVVPVSTAPDVILISLLPAGNAGDAAKHPGGPPPQGVPAAPVIQQAAPAPVVAPPRAPRGHLRAVRRSAHHRHEVRAVSAAPAEPARELPAPAAEAAAPGSVRHGGSSAASAANAAAGQTARPSAGLASGVASATGGGGGAGGGSGSDQRPRCVYCPEPSCPLIARARGWQGTVDIALLVLADGSVNAASLRRSSGHGALDRAALAVARQSRFTPPAAQGLPIPLHGRIEYRFQLSNAR